MIPIPSLKESQKLLRFSEKVSRKCRQAILISGSARSGTTILGKIVHSFQEIEYGFEPALFFPLFALIQSIPENSWRLLYESYLYNEILVPSLTGRGLNTNREDDSSIYHVKSEREIESRLSQSLSREAIERQLDCHRVALKIPDIVPYLPHFRTYYPDAKLMIMLRKAPEVIASILQKRWFKNETLQHQDSNWPFRDWEENRIPFWVETGMEEIWVGWTEINRAAYYYIMSNRGIKDISNPILIKYDDLVRDPLETTKALAEKTHASFGEKTQAILEGVRRVSLARGDQIPEGIQKDLKEELEYYSRLS